MTFYKVLKSTKTADGAKITAEEKTEKFETHANYEIIVETEHGVEVFQTARTTWQRKFAELVKEHGGDTPDPLPSAVSLFCDCCDCIVTQADDAHYRLDSPDPDMPDYLTAVELVTFCLLTVEDWTEIDTASGEGVHWDIEAVREEVKAWLGNYFGGF